MKAKISAAVARQFAEKLIGELSSACERIEIAGSLRRGKTVVGDIELVCVPKLRLDLLGEPRGASYLDEALSELVKSGKLTVLRDGARYKQFSVKTRNGKDVYIDIFITTPDRWGVIYLIRTGSAEFSHKFVTPKHQGGYMPVGMHIHDGRLYRNGQVLDTPEEFDVFREVGMRYIEPSKREVE